MIFELSGDFLFFPPPCEVEATAPNVLLEEVMEDSPEFMEFPVDLLPKFMGKSSRYA